MATDFTQDSVLHFIQSSGGSVKNSDLLLHYRGFIRDHADQDRNRELFKKFINSVATVQQIDGVKHVVLRKKFRGHVPGSGEGGSSGPPRLPAGRNSEPSAESARLSTAGRAEKPRQKATTPAPPGETAGKTILPAAGLIMLNNNNNNVETNLNLKQKQQQVVSTPEVFSRAAAVQVVGQAPEITEVKIPSMSDPPVQHQHPKAGPQHRMGHGPPPAVTPVVSAVRHHGGPSQQVPEPLRGRQACLQPEGGLLHQEPPLHQVGPHPQAAARRRHRHRPSYKSAVSYDDDEEEEEAPMGRGSAGGAWPVSVPLGDTQRAISTSSPCIIDPPAPPAVVSSSLTEVKLPKICIQNVEREMRPPSGPGRSFESAVGQRGQWAGPRLEPRSIPGEMTPTRRYTPSPDRARVVAPNHDVHMDYRSPQPAGVQLEPRQGPEQTQKVWQSSSNSIIFSPSSDAGLSSIPSDSPRGSEGNRSNDDLQTRTGRIRHRSSYKSAVSCDEDEEEEEEEVPVRRGSAGGAWPMSVPLGDMQRAFSNSSPCIIDPPAPPSVVSSSSSSGRKPPKICIQSVEGEMMPLGQPRRSFESGVGHRGQWIGSPRSVPGESMNTKRSLPLESSPVQVRVVAPQHDLYMERRSSQPECVHPELSQVPDQSQRLRLSSSHSSIFSPSSDAGLSSSDWPPSGPPVGSEWNSSYDDLLTRRAGKSGSGSAIQEVLQRAQRTRPESVTHDADINTTAPFHHSTGRLHDDEPRARVLPWHLSTGELYDDQGTESSEDSTSSPPLRQRPAVVRRLSSHLRNRMCRSMGADLDQLLQEEARGGAGGNEAARLNRLHLISSSLSLRYNLSSSSLSSCSTPPRCHSLADLVEGVEGKRGRKSMPSVPSSTAQHDGSSRQSVVPLEDKEHAWLVKGAAGAWPDIYSLFREDSSLLNRRDFISGFTVLHWIAKHGDHRVLNTLWYGVQKAGLTFDIDARSTCGHTPLHIAAIHGHKNIMRLLVSKFKANIKLRDTAGKRPWQYLSRNTSADVFQLLDAPPRAAGIEDKSWKPEQHQHRRRRRHHFSSAGERPLTIAGTTKVKRSSSIAAFLKHKSMRRFHAHQSDSSV